MPIWPCLWTDFFALHSVQKKNPQKKTFISYKIHSHPVIKVIKWQILNTITASISNMSASQFSFQLYKSHRDSILHISWTPLELIPMDYSLDSSQLRTIYLVSMKLLRKLPEEHILRAQAKTLVDQWVLEHMGNEWCQNMCRWPIERKRKALQGSKAKQINSEQASSFLMVNQLQKNWIENPTPKVTLGVYCRKNVQTRTTLRSPRLINLHILSHNLKANNWLTKFFTSRNNMVC